MNLCKSTFVIMMGHVWGRPWVRLTQRVYTTRLKAKMNFCKSTFAIMMGHMWGHPWVRWAREQKMSFYKFTFAIMMCRVRGRRGLG